MTVHSAHFQCMTILYFYISRGIVATSLIMDGIFNYQFDNNSPLSLSVKEFWKLVSI